MDRYALWREDVRKKQARKDAIRFAAGIAGVNFLAIITVFHLRYGALGGYDWSRTLSWPVLALIAVIDTAFVIAPHATNRIVGNELHRASKAVFDLFATVLLCLVFVVSFPFAATIGRSGYLRRHPAAAPWVQKTGRWQTSTWAKKDVDLVEVNRRSGSTVTRALGYFVRQRNYFLFAIAVVLVIIAAFTVFAQSSPVAPFIYSLF